MSALQQGNFCSFGVVNLDRQPVVKIIRQRGVNLVRQEVIFYASFSSYRKKERLSAGQILQWKRADCFPIFPLTIFVEQTPMKTQRSIMDLRQVFQYLSFSTARDQK